MTGLFGRTEMTVSVLVEWEDDGQDDATTPALVEFDGWSVVAGLYALVTSQEVIRRAVCMSGAFRTLGASIEVDSPRVRVRSVGDVGQRLGARALSALPLGDGLLLGIGDVAGLQCGREMDRPILRVQDDGILLVMVEDGWATIDLSALARAVGVSMTGE